MSEDKRPNAPPPGPDEDSLDFSDIGPSRVPRPTEPAPVDHRPARPREPKRAARAKAAPASAATTVSHRRRRNLIVPIVIVAALGAGALYVMNERISSEPEAPLKLKKPAPPAYSTAPVQKPAQTPPEKATPQAAAPAPPTIPPDFLKAFKDYTARPASKAIALAVDRNGRWAYGVIANHATQAEAESEALAECARFRTQSGVQENCRLYATGDQIVW